jgi:hypothetical protein
MSKFTSVNKRPGDESLVYICDGTIYPTKLTKKPILICQEEKDTYSSEITLKQDYIPKLPPKNILNQTNFYPGTDFNPNTHNRDLLHFTEPMRISGLLGGKVVAASKQEPILLYYRYDGGSFDLYSYNLETRTDFLILQKKIADISELSSCQFFVGAFGSKIYQDIFVSCNELGINNGFLIYIFNPNSQKSEYQLRDPSNSNYQEQYSNLKGWCKDSSTQNNKQQPIQIGEFNGDGLSDLICVATRSIMINKGGASNFKEATILTTVPGNWNARFNDASGNGISIGDIDGSGLSDFMSFTSDGKPQILYHDGLNGFKGRSSLATVNGQDDLDGSFLINYRSSWCGVGKSYGSSQTPEPNSGSDQEKLVDQLNGLQTTAVPTPVPLSNIQEINQLRMVSFDADNNGIEDLMCHNRNKDGRAYLMLSQNKAPAPLLKRLEVKLSNFVIGKNIAYQEEDYQSPIFCNAKIYTADSKISCSINAQNRVIEFAVPIAGSRNVPELNVKADIKADLTFGNPQQFDKDHSEKINNPDNVKWHYKFASEHKEGLGVGKFPTGKMWEHEDVRSNDPTRSFQSEYTGKFYRQGVTRSVINDHGKATYGRRTHGGDCEEIHYNTVKLFHRFAADGEFRAITSNNTLITEKTLLRELADLNIGHGTNVAITNVGRGVVSFTYEGLMVLSTLYQKKFIPCKSRDIILKSDKIESKQTEAASDALCALQGGSGSDVATTDRRSTNAPNTKANSPLGASIISRNDTLLMDGLVHAGIGFFPERSKVNLTSVDKYPTVVSEVHSRLQFSNNTKLEATVQTFTHEPYNELRLSFIKDGEVIHEPGGPNSPYAAFNHIKSAKLHAFDHKSVLVSWAIYHAPEKQYYIFVDYANLGGNLLRIPSYNEEYSIAIPEPKFGNIYVIAYRPSLDTIVITQYLAGLNDPLTSKEISVEPETLTNYQIKAEGDYILLERTHNNHKGLIIQKFDRLSGREEPETNLICDTDNDNAANPSASTGTATNQITGERVPTNADAAYQTLRLHYKHASKIVYHDDNKSENLKKKVALQNTLNYINHGIKHLESLANNPDKQVESNLENALSQLVCSSTLPPSQITFAINLFNTQLSGDLTFHLHSAQSAKENQCKTYIDSKDENSNSQSQATQGKSSYYPIYREGTNIHLCPGFEEIIDQFNECNQLIKSASITKNLLSPELPQIDSTQLQKYVSYFPDGVIAALSTIFNTGEDSNSASAPSGTNNNAAPNGVCHDITGGYKDVTTHLGNIASIIVAGLLSEGAPGQTVSIDECRSQVQNQCQATNQQGTTSQTNTRNTQTSTTNTQTGTNGNVRTEKEANKYCLPYIVNIASTAYLVTQAAHSHANPTLNCVTGCSLNSKALDELTKSLGGFTNPIQVEAFFPHTSSHATTSNQRLTINNVLANQNGQSLVNTDDTDNGVQSSTNPTGGITPAPGIAPTASQGPSSTDAPTPTNTGNISVTDDDLVLVNKEIGTVVEQNVLTATATHFYNLSMSLLTFASLGNNYISLSSGYYAITDHTAIGLEQELGRYQNIKQINSAAFNNSAVLVAYSVKHPGYQTEHNTQSNQNDQSTQNAQSSQNNENYNILVHYISPNTNMVVNIGNTAYNGVFSIAVVPYDKPIPSTQNSNDQHPNSNHLTETEFLVSYADSATSIATKRYKVTTNAITQQSQSIEAVTHEIPKSVGGSLSKSQDDTQSNTQSTSTTTYSDRSFMLSVNAFLDNTYNIVWSYLNDAGIYIQRYSMSPAAGQGQSSSTATDTKIGFTENIVIQDSNGQNKAPHAVRVDSGTRGKTQITWQHNDEIYAKMVTQADPALGMAQVAPGTASNPSPTLENGFKVLNFTASDYQLSATRIVDEGNNLVSIGLQHVNNTNSIKRILTNAASDKITYQDTLFEENSSIVRLGDRNFRNITKAISGSTPQAINFDKILDKIMGTLKDLNIKAPTQDQCKLQANRNIESSSQSSTTSSSDQFNINNILNQTQNLLKNKPELIAQMQTALAGPDITSQLSKFAIRKEVLYSLLNEVDNISEEADLANISQIKKTGEDILDLLRNNPIVREVTEYNEILKREHNINLQDKDSFINKVVDILQNITDNKITEEVWILLWEVIYKYMDPIISSTGLSHHFHTQGLKEGASAGLWIAMLYGTIALGLLMGAVLGLLFGFEGVVKGATLGGVVVLVLHLLVWVIFPALAMADGDRESNLVTQADIHVNAAHSYLYNTFLGSHNSMGSSYNGYAYLQNQVLSIEAQLNKGIRTFNLDIYKSDIDHEVLVCHGCNMGFWPGITVGLRRNNDNDNSNYIEYYFRAIKNWQGSTPVKPSRIVTIAFQGGTDDDIEAGERPQQLFDRVRDKAVKVFHNINALYHSAEHRSAPSCCSPDGFSWPVLGAPFACVGPGGVMGANSIPFGSCTGNGRYIESLDTMSMTGVRVVLMFDRTYDNPAVTPVPDWFGNQPDQIQRGYHESHTDYHCWGGEGTTSVDGVAVEDMRRPFILSSFLNEEKHGENQPWARRQVPSLDSLKMQIADCVLAANARDNTLPTSILLNYAHDLADNALDTCLIGSSPRSECTDIFWQRP